MKPFYKRFSCLLKVFSITLFLFCSQITMAHWGSKGPYGADVLTMITVDTNVYIGTLEGGIFRSTNKNLTAWTVRNNGLGAGTVTAFTNTGTTVFAAVANNGIYVTTDIGATWTKVSTGTINNQYVYELSTFGTTLYAGTRGGGMFKSIDNGVNWTSVNVGTTTDYVMTFVVAGNTLYAGTEAGIYKTTDGSSWSDANTNLPSNRYTYKLVANGTSIYALTFNGVYSSPLSSISWTIGNTGLPDIDVLTTLYDYNGTLYLGTHDGVYSSSDAGALSWATTGNAIDSVTAITYLNNRLVIGTLNNGVYKSNVSTINWTAFNTGINNLETRTFFAEGSLIISATNWGVFVSRDIATSYVRANNGLTDSTHVNSLLFVGTTLYAGTEYGGVFVSADTGRTWTTANTGLSNLNVKYIVSYATQLATVSSGGAVFTSSASSINWTSVPVAFPSVLPITAILINGTNIYASTMGDGVYKFNGLSWAAVNTGLTNTNITDLEILGSKIFASTLGGGIYVSDLSSISWIASNSGLPSANVYSMGVVGQYVVAGLTGQVYATFDNGQSWLPTNVQLNLPEYANITGVQFTSARVFVSTPYNSLYSNAQSELPVITSVLNPAISNRSAEEIVLYPNPAQGVFSIAFTQPDEVLQNVTVSNSIGVVLQNALSPENLTPLNKGIYIITIVTNKGISTQKLVVQ